MSVFEKLIHFDFWLFFKINGVWTNGVFDSVFPFLRESVIWVPLYLFLLIFILFNFGKHGIYWSVVLICTASLCDIISSHMIKEAIFRLRPCRTELIHPVRFLVVYCPMNSGFVSSHAVNHFGLATFIYGTLKRYTSSGWMSCFLVWAAIIAYAQVYVGVHFPLDVICGALVGCLLGYLSSNLFNKYIGLTPESLKSS